MKTKSITNQAIEKAIEVTLEESNLSCHDLALSHLKKFNSDIANLFYRGIDAYRLARLMDDAGWHVNANFVEDMDIIIYHIDRQHRASVGAIL